MASVRNSLAVEVLDFKKMGENRDDGRGNKSNVMARRVRNWVTIKCVSNTLQTNTTFHTFTRTWTWNERTGPSSGLRVKFASVRACAVHEYESKGAFDSCLSRNCKDICAAYTRKCKNRHEPYSTHAFSPTNQHHQPFLFDHPRPRAGPSAFIATQGST